MKFYIFLDFEGRKRNLQREGGNEQGRKAGERKKNAPGPDWGRRSRGIEKYVSELLDAYGAEFKTVSPVA